jgi:predicted nucleic acid-binding protein
MDGIGLALGLLQSVITVKELEYGVALRERRDPARGAVLRRWLEGLLEGLLEEWEGSQLALDWAIARWAAWPHPPDPAPEADAYLGATALERDLTMVPGNIIHFRGLAGLRLIDPWSPAT